MRQFIVASLRAYKRFISPLLPSACRFHPTCSEYMREAVEIHGASKGVWLGLRRLLRCHPFCEGGIDHVPGSHAHQYAKSSKASHLSVNPSTAGVSPARPQTINHSS